VLAVIESGVLRHAIDHLGKTLENLDAGLVQLDTHGDGQRAANDSRDDRED
jgi:hypothetical protein